MSKNYLSFMNRSTLISKNITVLGHRTSVRLEPDMWKELKNISKREACSVHDLCSLISLRKAENTSLTAAIRVFLMLYFRAAATEEGHGKAGHGNFQNMKRRAGVAADWSALEHQREMEDRFTPHLRELENNVANESRTSS